MKLWSRNDRENVCLWAVPTVERPISLVLLGWLIGMYLLVRVIWRLALRKVVIFGGGGCDVTFRQYVHLYLEFLKQAVKVWVEYRGDFLIGALSTVTIQGASILFIAVVLGRIHELNGWTGSTRWSRSVSAWTCYFNRIHSTVPSSLDAANRLPAHRHDCVKRWRAPFGSTERMQLRWQSVPSHWP